MAAKLDYDPRLPTRLHNFATIEDPEGPAIRVIAVDRAAGIRELEYRGHRETQYQCDTCEDFVFVLYKRDLPSTETVVECLHCSEIAWWQEFEDLLIEIRDHQRALPQGHRDPIEAPRWFDFFREKQLSCRCPTANYLRYRRSRCP